MADVLLFDLDDTLIVEEPAAVAAFEATARHAAARRRLDAGLLARGARMRARELWRAAPTYPYCRRVGISSWEGLWCRYRGDTDELQRLRAWSPEYRRETWRLALADQGIADDGLAVALGERFGTERRARHEVFADAEPALEALAATYDLRLVTNGASCLQREKLAASGLGGYFTTIVVSADLGSAKPDPAVFARALGAGDRARAVMIGDSVEKDIAGARALGLRGIWVNRTGRPRPGELAAPQVRTLAELPAVLSAL